MTRLDVLSTLQESRWIRLWLDHRAAARPWLLNAGTIAGGSVAVALAAQCRLPVPGTDVPMTLQPLAVLLVGYLLEPIPAAAAVAMYLFVGICGLPVFASSGGYLGPTSGYLVGFVIGAGLVSVVRSGGNQGTLRRLLAGVLGMTVIFGAGSLWRLALALWFTDYDVPWRLALTGGVVPFVPKAIIEVLLATGLVAWVRRRRLPASARCVG